jgi:hypothetical protein
MGWALLTWARKNWLAIAIALAALSLYLVGYSNGKQSEKAETAKVQAKFDAYKSEIKKAVTKQIAQNAAKEAQDRAVFAQIASQYAKDIENAKAKSDSVIAGLRNGNIKLRKQWQGCSARAESSADTAGIDENAELREQGAGDIIRLTAEADAQVKGLQDGWKQCEKRYEPGL